MNDACRTIIVDNIRYNEPSFCKLLWGTVHRSCVYLNTLRKLYRRATVYCHCITTQTGQKKSKERYSKLSKTSCTAKNTAVCNVEKKIKKHFKWLVTVATGNANCTDRRRLSVVRIAASTPSAAQHALPILYVRIRQTSYYVTHYTTSYYLVVVVHVQAHTISSWDPGRELDKRSLL